MRINTRAAARIKIIDEEPQFFTGLRTSLLDIPIIFILPGKKISISISLLDYHMYRSLVLEAFFENFQSFYIYYSLWVY